jgi:hypothetical protein
MSEHPGLRKALLSALLRTVVVVAICVALALWLK